MENRDLISIIVPVYNAENYIKKCVESLLRQDYQDIEIILVNDGSKDGSGFLCNELSKFDNRIKVIHQKNSGVSAARNNGLKNANGSYVGFVDSDDYIDQNMYSKLFEKMRKNDCDVVYCDSINVDKAGCFYNVDTIYSIESEKKIKVSDLSANQLIEVAGSVWRGLYRREIINYNNIEFPLNLKFSEDRIFNLLYLSKIKNVYYYKEHLYYRLVDENTTVQRYHENHFEAVKQAYILTDRIRGEFWPAEIFKKSFDRQFINNVYGSLNNYYSKSSTMTIVAKYKKVKSICNDELVENAINSLDNSNVRDKYLRNKNYILLSLLTLLGNKKNKK